MRTPLRTVGSALTVGMVALLGVGSLSPADAAAAGINRQALSPTTSQTSASALPSEASRSLRLVVDEHGRAHLA